MSIISKKELLFNSLTNFYMKEDNFETFINILNSKEKEIVSLRLLDYLCTKYCKTNTVIYNLPDNKGKINLYNSYKNQLKAYSKKFFDPFCRQKRLIINTVTFKWREYTEESISDTEIVTTVGQLNFFRWFIDNKILDYALSNIKFIDADMINTMASKKKGKRSVLSPSAVKGIYTNKCSVTIKFKP